MSEAVTGGNARPFSARFEGAGYALGFGLGGFFDGILLHQVLQWHHLLSGIAAARQDIRVLILADGLFHLLMYVVTGLGLWLLWRTRRDFAAPGADRRLLANALIGFGAWHVIDGVLSHWVLGVHRIRMDVDNPLFWDVLWLGAFGLVPLAIGWLVRAGGPDHTRRIMSSPLALVLAVAVAAPLAALPAPGDGPVMVLFRPGISPAEAAAAMQAVGGRLVWTDPSQQLWALDLPANGDLNRLYAHGALLVSNAILPAGCLDWIRI